MREGIRTGRPPPVRADLPFSLFFFFRAAPSHRGKLASLSHDPRDNKSRARREASRSPRRFHINIRRKLTDRMRLRGEKKRRRLPERFFPFTEGRNYFEIGGNFLAFQLYSIIGAARFPRSGTISRAATRARNIASIISIQRVSSYLYRRDSLVETTRARVCVVTSCSPRATRISYIHIRVYARVVSFRYRHLRAIVNKQVPRCTCCNFRGEAAIIVARLFSGRGPRAHAVSRLISRIAKTVVKRVSA